MKTLVAVTTLLGLVYLNTATIAGTGGPGEALVFKPLHGFWPFYGGGEENAWTRAHPDQPLPWWHYPNTDYVVLHATSYETTIAPWTLFYDAGYFVFLSLLIFWAFKLHRWKRIRLNQAAP